MDFTKEEREIIVGLLFVELECLEGNLKSFEHEREEILKEMGVVVESIKKFGFTFRGDLEGDFFLDEIE